MSDNVTGFPGKTKKKGTAERLSSLCCPLKLSHQGSHPGYQALFVAFRPGCRIPGHLLAITRDSLT